VVGAAAGGVGHNAGMVVVTGLLVVAVVVVVVVVGKDSVVDAVARTAGMEIVTKMVAVVVVVVVVGKQAVRAVAPSCSDTMKKVEGVEALE
jgi:hypothetical protein